MDNTNTPEHDVSADVVRKPFLIANRTNKMARTYVLGTLCAAAVVIVDSLIAGVSIGEAALAAIAISAPFLMIDQILHCLLGYGIDKLMVQAIGEGRRKEANRIFGAILITVLVVYLVVFILLILMIRPLLEFTGSDPVIVDMAVSYLVPLFATAPIFETFLCIERAFRIDGRAKLFAMRAVVTNIANIVLDILMVSVLMLGISGLAWASVIASLIGYAISLSHFFSEKRTVSPDLSVVFALGELLSYVKMDIRLGSSATLDEAMSTVSLGVQTAAIGAIAGPDGLAIWAVYKSLQGVVLSVGNGISASVSVHAGLLYGQEDYNGIRYAIKKGCRIALIASLANVLLVLVLAHPISVVYGIESGIQSLCAQCLRIGCVLFPAICFLSVIASYLPAVNRVMMCNRLVLIQYALIIVAAAIGFSVGLQAFFALYALAAWAAAAILILFLVRDRFWFVPERNPEALAEYSVTLNPEQISTMAIDVRDKLRGCGYPELLCFKTAVAIEESMSYISQHNSGTNVLADIKIGQHEGGIQVLIIDDGVAYNPLVLPAEEDMDKPGALEALIVLGFTVSVTYDRVLELNDLSLTLSVPAED